MQVINMKKILTLLVFLPLFCVEARGEVVLIETAEQLAAVSATGEYTLSGDIDLTDVPWKPIKNFSGIFDGAGYAINGLSSALFGAANNAQIMNLTISNAAIPVPSRQPTAGILANEISDSRVTNICITNSEISARGKETNLGGLVGLVNGTSTFENNFVAALVSGDGIVGGFAGAVTGVEKKIGATFENNYVFGRINASGLIGGFAGSLSGCSRILHSHSHANIFADETSVAGGFVGEISNSSRIEFSAATGAVIGGETTGGFVGIISREGAPNTITNSAALGAIVAGEGVTRRFAARTDHDGINNCYANLGMAVFTRNRLSHATPSPYGPDGGDYKNR
jgi:hypothetical protein